VIIDDRVEELHDLIKDCDGLVIGSPTYYGNVTGLFKTFQDRVHMILEQLLHNKPCVIISTYEFITGSKTINIMKNLVESAGGYSIAKILIKNSSYYSDPLTERNKRKIEKAARLIIKEAHKHKPPILSRISRKISLNLIFKRYIFKDKNHNIGIINSWIEKKLTKSS
jgi:NAD(P)H-dependent FMN reductase